MTRTEAKILEIYNQQGQLPTVKTMAEQLALKPSTIESSIRSLRHQGLLPESARSLKQMQAWLEEVAERLVNPQDGYAYESLDEFFWVLDADLSNKLHVMKRYFTPYLESLRERVPLRAIQGPKVLFEQLPASA